MFSLLLVKQLLSNSKLEKSLVTYVCALCLCVCACACVCVHVCMHACVCVCYSMYLLITFCISYTSSVNCIWFPIVSYVHYSSTSSIGTSLSNKLLYTAKLLRGSFCTSIWKMFIACIFVLLNDKGIVCNNRFAIKWKMMKTTKVSPWKFCHTYMVQSLKSIVCTHMYMYVCIITC